jgi:hypothetical protein
MVAKGVKRSEEGTAPPQKKTKVDPKIASVKQTIESADLPEPCKAMLLAMIPHSLDVHQNLRCEAQSRAVDMIGEVYDAIELKLKNVAESESAKVTEIEASKDTMEAALAEAETRHSATTATVESCKAALAQCFSTANERKLALAAAEESERTGNAPGFIAEEEHRGLQSALDEHLKVLKEGSWETGSAKRHLDALLPLATKLTDESLVTALPSTCIKPPAERSTFDNMVIDQLESSLMSRLTQLSSSVEAEKPAKAQRAAEVATAQHLLKEAENAQQKASDDTASALSAQKDALAVLELARTDVVAFKPTLRKAKEAADEAQAELELFHDNCRVGCFDSLKTKVSVEATPSNIETTKGEDLISTTVTDVSIGGC